MNINVADLSTKAKKLFDLLSVQERETIQKDYPFRLDRNNAIRKIRSRGVDHAILCEITGLAIVTIKRINSTEPKGKRLNMAQVYEKIKEIKRIIVSIERDLEKNKKT